jgi:hypothetical protein
MNILMPLVELESAVRHRFEDFPETTPHSAILGFGDQPGGT